MMQYYQNKEVQEAYTQRVIDLMEGRRTMPPVSYDGDRRTTFHASDFDVGLCPLPSYYSRIIIPPPPLDIESALKFLRGRVIERAIASELKPVEVDGIHCTVDDKHPTFGYTEIKSTASTFENFNPEEDYPYWISRMKTYCHVNDVDSMNLVVFFLVGNTNSFTIWGIKEKPKDSGYCGVKMDAWTFEFTADELRENWFRVQVNKEFLEQAIHERNPAGIEHIVAANLPYRERKSGRDYWQCKGCRYQEYCYYYEEYIKEEQ